MLISKEEYILVRVINYVGRKAKENQDITAGVLQELIAQWEFDYRIELEYQPEVLEKTPDKKNA